MGKGDKKSRRGKINIGSFGVTRPRKKKVSTPVAAEKKEKPVKKKAAAPKAEKPKAEKPKAPKKAAAKKKAAED